MPTLLKWTVIKSGEVYILLPGLALPSSEPLTQTGITAFVTAFVLSRAGTRPTTMIRSTVGRFLQTVIERIIY